MEYLLDTGNIEIIQKLSEIYPVTGVTSNPSILKKEGNVPFFRHLNEIRSIIGMDKTLHVQVTCSDSLGMQKEADAILERVDANVYIKIPVTEEGLKTIQLLKKQNVNVTATGIYHRTQGFLAIAAGADFIAPYCNRMASLDIDFRKTINAFKKMIDENGLKTKILAASFHCIEQVNDAFLAGAHAATVDPVLLQKSLQSADVNDAVNIFAKDWEMVRKGIPIFMLR